MRAVFKRSVGVTAKIEAATPVAMPARRLRAGERVPVTGSANWDFMVSKERKRTPSLAMEPCGWERCQKAAKRERRTENEVERAYDDQCGASFVQCSDPFITEYLSNDFEGVSRGGDATLIAKLDTGFCKLERILRLY